jgi:hypothetical protein
MHYKRKKARTKSRSAGAFPSERFDSKSRARLDGGVEATASDVVKMSPERTGCISR